jgi:hypothetical protein
MCEAKQIEPESLVAVAKRSMKPVNQDACASVTNQAVGIRAVVIADGIGSHEGAEKTSAKVVTEIASQIYNEVPPFANAWEDISTMQAIFRRTHEQLELHRALQDQTDGPATVVRPSPGTTALCLVEHHNRLVIAYTGNGSILDVRADFNEFPEAALLPWSSIDLVNPHSKYVRGKNVLYRYLSADASSAQATPTVLVLGKDIDGPGDIFIAVTDGIASRDQAVVGKNEMGIWTRADSAVPLLYRCLDRFFRRGAMTSEDLQRELETYLEEFEASGEMDDDCAIGVLITGRAVMHQVKRMEKKKEEGGRSA